MIAGDVETGIKPGAFSWTVSWFSHYLVAIVGGMVIGFLPEAVVSRAYYNTGLEPYSPMIALTAFLLGYFAADRIFDGRAASFVWIIGLVWFVVGIYDTLGYQGESWSTRFDYAVANLLGLTRECSGSECLGELFFTTPFVASVTYSIGAWARRMRRATLNGATVPPIRMLI